MPAGEFIRNVFEHPQTFVGARENQFTGRETPCLLQRDAVCQPVHLGLIGNAVVEHIGGVPDLGDDPIGTTLIGDCLRKCYEAIGVLGCPDGVDCRAITVRIKRKPGRIHLPFFAGHPA